MLHSGLAARKVGADLDQRGLRRGDLEVAQQGGAEQLVDQDAAMLRIVAEFDDVPMAVVGLQQVGLGASAHFSHVPDRGERHRKENAVT